MKATQHALLAHALIEACGGVDACCSPVTRVERSALYKYRDPKSGVFMPADVIEALERKAKNPLYSGMLFGQIEVEAPTEDALREAADVDEAGNDVWRFIRRVMADGERPLSENELKEAERLVQRVEREAAELRQILQLGRAPS